MDGRWPLAFEEVRRVHGMAAFAQALGERAHPFGESLNVMKENNLGHLSSLAWRRFTVRHPPAFPRSSLAEASFATVLGTPRQLSFG